MINIFSQNIKKEEYDGLQLFVVRCVDPEISKKADEQVNELNTFEKKAALPTFLNVICYISFLGAALITGGIFKALKDVSFKEAFNNAKVLIIIGIILWVVFAILFIIKYFKNKQVVSSDEFKESINEANRIYEESLINLNIPLDSSRVDVFVFFYEERKGKIVQAVKEAQYLVVEHRVFKENNNLCLADCNNVISFPIDCFKKIDKINNKVSFMNWNKDDAPNKGIYKDYKIKTNDNNSIHSIKSYYRFEFEYNFNQYEFYVPAYDAQAIIDIINLPVNDENVKEDLKEV